MIVVSSRLRKVCAASLISATAVLWMIYLFAPTYVATLRPTSIVAESGHSVVAAIPDEARFPFVSGWDSPSGPSRSDAALFEDGRPLGPAHAAHADIRAGGKGRFSIWEGQAFFSSSDNSDPRTNGRVYTVRYGTSPAMRIVLGVLLADALAMIWFRRAVLAFLGRRLSWIAAALTLAFVLRLVGAATGGMPAVFSTSATTIDASLVGAIVLHASLGLGLGVVIFATGAGVLRYIFGPRAPSGHDLVLKAYLPGVAMLTAMSLVAIYLPYGGYLALLLAIAVGGPALRDTDRSSLARCARGLLPIFLATSLFAIVLGFRFHGPTDTLPGAPIGDTTIYVGVAHSFLHAFAPLVNLGNEGFRLSYLNGVPSIIAAAFMSQKWFDAYLLFSTTLVVTGLMSTGVLLRSLVACRMTEGGYDSSRRHVAVIAALFAVAFRFPADLVNSPSFTLFVPVVIVTFYLWRKEERAGAVPWQAFGIAFMGTVMTKVVGLAVLGPLVLTDTLRRLRVNAGRRQHLWTTAVGIGLLVYVVAMLAIYLPAFLKIGVGPRCLTYLGSGVTSEIFVYAMMRDVGAIVIGLASLRFRLPGLAIGTWSGVLAWLVLPFVFYTALTTAVLLLALSVAVAPERARRAEPFIAVAVLLFLPDMLVWDPGGMTIPVVWALVALALSYIAASSPRTLAETRRSLVVTGFAAASIALLLFGAGSGIISVGPDTFLFTPQVRDIWQAVGKRTPRDALIFTDQTDDTESRTGGWNSFALAAGRQFYLVSWDNTPLRWNSRLKAEWLARNAAVLEGRLRPGDLPLSRHYDGFYAVIGSEKPRPPGSDLLYDNGVYSLYRLASSA